MNLSEKLEIASQLFASQPSASAINSLLSDTPTSADGGGGKIRVWQNHSAAIVSKALQAFASYFGIQLLVDDHGYDDSFTWYGLEPEHVQIVWVDIDRIDADSSDSRKRFVSRIAELSIDSLGPIFVIVASKNMDLAQQWCLDVAGVLGNDKVMSIWGNGGEFQVESVIDLRMEKVGGTYVSMRRQNQIARDLYTKINGSILASPKKLVVFDMDWTLYNGVLLEDGVEGISFDQSHIELWGIANKLFQSGVMLGIASKNEHELVLDFFNAHHETIGLAPSQFIAIEANFGAKSQNILSMIDLARTTPRDVVFIDDNVGEIAQVLSEIPELNVVVGNMSQTTNRWLSSFPGINLEKIDDNVETRLLDIKARAMRDRDIADVGTRGKNPSDVLNELGLEVGIRKSNLNDLDRLADMIARTNQFNANLVRLSPEEVKSYAEINENDFVTATLRDKFVDSGIIFAALTSRESGSSELVIDSLVMSCRAMGRGLEPVIVWKSLLSVANSNDIEYVKFSWTKGPRNLPFFEFMEPALADESTINNPVDDVHGYTLVRKSTIEKLSKVDFEVKTLIEE